MSTYESPTGIAKDRVAEDRLHDLGVELDINADGDVVSTYEDPTSRVTIVAYADGDAPIGATHEAFAAVCQQTILELGFRQEVDR